MSFATQQIELSMCNPQTGLPLAANVYTIEGVTEADGTPRLMSIGQLVMAICLQRASALEDQIIGVMNDINANTQLLEALTTIENALVAVDVDGEFAANTMFNYNGNTISYQEFLVGSDYLQMTGFPVDSQWSYDQSQTAISLIEDKMDSLNTISQDTLIQLQSLTTKRDQTYDLVSNVLKSLNNVLVGNANNL